MKKYWQITIISILFILGMAWLYITIKGLYWQIPEYQRMWGYTWAYTPVELNEHLHSYLRSIIIWSICYFSTSIALISTSIYLLKTKILKSKEN